MKTNQLFFSMLFFFTISVFLCNTGCKKGEDDPFISLKSRNARLMQEWNLTKIEGERRSSYDTTRFEYNDNTFLRLRNEDTIISLTGNLTIEFKENGVSYVSETTIQYDETLTNEGIGTWSWMDSDKSKNFLFIWNETFIDSYFINAYTLKFYVNRLSSNELILKYYLLETWGGNTWTYDFTYTFTAN